VGRPPENPKLVAVREFPARLVRAKKHYEITKAVEVSWAWIADQTGKSTTVMSQIKNGEREPSLEEVVVFAALFGVRAEWLAFNDGPMLNEGGQGANPDVHSPQRTGPATTRTVDKTYPAEIQPRQKPKTKQRPKRDDRTAIAV
jgi:hypothetical protein